MALQNFIATLNQEPKVNLAHSNPIPFETLKTLYLEAFNRIGWTQGLMSRPEVIQAEDRLNQVWLDCMEGRASLLDFKETITGWEGIISGAIRQG